MTHSLSIWVVSLLLLLSFLLLLKTKTRNKKPPPGPPKLPLLGHLHLIGSLPHRSLRELSRNYGPIMLLKLGSVPTIVISSAAAAREVLQVHDLACCSRPCLAASARFSYNFLDIGLSPYSDHWREVRKICVLELFSARRVQSFQLIREEEVSLLLKSISQSSSSAIPVDLSEISYTLTANITTRIAFGKSFRGNELDNGNFHQVIRRAIAALGSFSMTDFFPSVGWVIDRFSGVNGRLEKSFAELDAFLQQVVEDRINFRATSQNEENIVDVLLKMERGRFELDALQLTRDCIKAIIMVSYIIFLFLLLSSSKLN